MGQLSSVPDPWDDVFARRQTLWKVADEMMGAALLIVAGVLLIDLLIRGYFVGKVLKIFETKPPFNVPHYPAIPQAEAIEFATTDGLTLRGSLFHPSSKPGRGLVVFFPELDGCHWSAMSYADCLVRAGFHLLSFDFRNQGSSDSRKEYAPIHWPTHFELADARAAMNFIRSRPDLCDLPLGVMGISRGSQTALAIAAENPAVRAACCEGAYSTEKLVTYFTLRWAFLYVPSWAMKLLPLWHFRITLAMTKLVSQWRRRCQYLKLERWLPMLSDRPVLLIAGERDNYVHPEISQALCKDLGPLASVWIAPQSKHNRARETNPQEFDRRVIGFFQSHLGPVAARVRSTPRQLSAAS